MIAAWPSELPRPTRPSYGAQRQNAQAPQSGSTGPALGRLRFSAVARLVELAIKVDPDQALVFDHFYSVTLKEGSRPFTMPDLVRDGRQLRRETGAQLLTDADVPVLVGSETVWLFERSSTPVEGPLQGHLREIVFRVMEMP